MTLDVGITMRLCHARPEQGVSDFLCKWPWSRLRKQEETMAGKKKKDATEREVNDAPGPRWDINVR